MVDNSRNAILEAKSVSFSCRGNMLFDKFCMDLSAGSWIALLGANGSGKSTLLRILCGLIWLPNGKVLWHGKNIATVREAFYTNIIYLGHKCGFKSEQTIRQNLDFFAEFKKAGDYTPEQAVRHFGIEHLLDCPCSKLSAGQLRKAALCRLLVERTQLWLLDEPSAELDVPGRLLLEQEIRRHIQKGNSAIIATHQDFTSLHDLKAKDIRLHEAQTDNATFCLT